MAKSRRKLIEHHEGAEAAWRSETALNRVLAVSKEELQRREAAYQESLKGKTRRGPRPAKPR